MMSSMTIGITECSKWKNYANWIRHTNALIEVVRLSWRENNLAELDRCDALLLTGGEDVHPRFYGKPEYAKELDPKEVNERRDEFELRIIDQALKNEIPILGICRGLQIANVYFKGTLIFDLPKLGKPNHAKAQGYDQTHTVQVMDNSLLKKIVKINFGEVNSTHHQAADRVGKELKVSAISNDGVIEGIEWKEPDKKCLLLLVQWHPERMKSASSSFSKNLRDRFFLQVQKEKTFSERN